tara:strand:+ start:1648 stop:2718 length:1071 start_codon:yes stop_codon:yes gene_type:complete
MAKTYKPIGPKDRATTRTLLHEACPVTGTIVSGAYGTWPNDDNIKNYTHGQFQSVYDYPTLSSSANHIFDIMCGLNPSGSDLYSTATEQYKKKRNNWNLVTSMMVGFSASGDVQVVRPAETDLNLDGSNPMNDMFMVCLSSLLTKDEIKKGSVSIAVGNGAFATPFSKVRTFQDVNATATGAGTKTTDGGQYGLLIDTTNEITGGIVWYQGGQIWLSSSCFMSGAIDGNGTTAFYATSSGGSWSVQDQLVSGTISGSGDAFRHRLQNLSFNNTTAINSQIYFCRVGHSDFNYSTNPTYLDKGKIRVKNVASDNPVTYVTTVGLYNASNELVAVAKLSEPLKKTPENEITIRVRLDY